MVKFLVPQRFTKQSLSEETFKRFTSFLGPLPNFLGASTIQYLNIRILFDDRGKKFRIVNDYNHKYNYKIAEYLKGFFRTYSDGIFTTVKYI
jgi:hypothetical protein